MDLLLEEDVEVLLDGIRDEFMSVDCFGMGPGGGGIPINMPG